LSPSEEHRPNHQTSTTYSNIAYSIPPSASFPLRTSADGTDSHVTQLFEPDPYPSTIQQTSRQQRQQQKQQQHEIGWNQSPSNKFSKKEDLSPMLSTMSCASFASPPPKKRRFMASFNVNDGDNNPKSSESMHNSVFRSPAEYHQWNFSSVRVKLILHVLVNILNRF